MRKNFQEKLTKQTLTVVGSGIAGLMTAWEAQKNGYQVTILSQSPDPRKSKEGSEQLSCTFDGQDQRYITLFEGHPYVQLAGYIDKMYPDIAGDFMRTVLEGGMLAKPFNEFREKTQQWLKARSDLNDKLREGDEKLVNEMQDLFESYEQENRAAMDKWYDFLQEILQHDPTLPKTLSLSYEGIIRLYDSDDVFEQAKTSHERGGVLKRTLTPHELAEEHPAYATGVENGFIAGGAVEMYGLTLGIKSLAKAMMNLLEKRGVEINFNTPIETIVVEDGTVQGLKASGEGKLYVSKSYAVHPGAFAPQSLFEQIPEAQNTLAAMEGYWITIEGADNIIQKMGDKPNKVHGKQSLSGLLDKVSEESQTSYVERFAELGINKGELSDIVPIVDFNNMPIRKDGALTLGVGSGYIYKGMAYNDEKTGELTFSNNPEAEKFVLTVMELWLEVLHGKELLEQGTLKAHDKGCKRSWSINDKEMEIALPTKDGGVMVISGGGNTGCTTKSTLVAKVIVELMNAVQQAAKTTEERLREAYQEIRQEAAQTVEGMGADYWERKTEALGKAVEKAKKQNVISQHSGRNEGKSNSGMEL